MCVCVYVCCRPPSYGVCPIMMWWSYKLRQGFLLSLCSVANCYILFFLTRPYLSSHFLISFRGGHLPPALTPPPPACLRTGSSTHLGITCLRPNIPMPPSTPLLLAICDPLLRPSLAPVTPAGFLLPPNPCRCKNRFHHEPQMVFR